MNQEYCIDVCNELLRGERAAVETYNQVIKKFVDEPMLPDLQRIRNDHAISIVKLEENVRSMGGTPEKDASAWSIFSDTIQSTTHFVGPNSAVEALKSGEKTEQNGYEGALEDIEVMIECKEIIRAELLPQTREHIATLERLQRTASQVS